MPRYVLSVGATGPINQMDFDQLAGYSNHGDKAMDLVAPGGNRRKLRHPAPATLETAI